MKRIMMILVSAFALNVSTAAFAADAGAKPDCAEKQKALDDANAAVKSAGKPDLSSCKDKKGKEKTDCETPIKDKAKTDARRAKDKAKEAKTALACCKNPKKKGCTPSAPASESPSGPSLIGRPAREARGRPRSVRKSQRKSSAAQARSAFGRSSMTT